jgi:hypothetical protein
MDDKKPTIQGLFEGLFSTLDHLAGANAAHQLILARLLIDSISKEKKPLSAISTMHRDLMSEVGGFCRGSDHKAGHRIRSEVREEIDAIVRLVRDGLKQPGD